MSLAANCSNSAPTSSARAGRSPSPIGRSTRNTDQPVYRMTVLSSRAFFPSTMTSLSRLGEGGAGLGSGCAGGTNAGRDAEPVVRRAAHGQAGNRGDSPSDTGHPVDVADPVLGQAAAPSRDQGVYG